MAASRKAATGKKRKPGNAGLSLCGAAEVRKMTFVIMARRACVEDRAPSYRVR